MKDLKFENEYDKKDFFELFENNCLKEINEYNYLKIYVFDLDDYYEAFTFNNDNIMVGREISRV